MTITFAHIYSSYSVMGMLRFFNMIALLLLMQPVAAQVGVIKGRIISDEGNPLPFATIYIKETGSGSISNDAGYYELKLQPGSYTLVFQYLSYQTQSMNISIGTDAQTLDIVMMKVAYTLAETKVQGGKEDPAYKIIRKAIAKSGYHRQQVDHYTCEVYLKGGGRLVDAPRIFRKMLEKEGMDTSATFITESVSRITFNRPASYKEEVIHIRANGDNRDSSPMGYINGSFYEPTVGNIISPLSPKAFAHYRFRYVSTFTDREYQVSQIEVRPRGRGEDLVSGMLYIVDGLWCLHSVDFALYVQGVNLGIKQVFNPVAEGVWLPVTHRFEGWGKILGVKFEFGYLAAVSKYDITLNPDLSNEIIVYDDKTEQDLIALSRETKQEAEAIPADDAEARLTRGEELTQKELRQLMRRYEKEERKKSDQPEVIATRDFKIDSLAQNSDSLFWADRRPIPLNHRELKGYTLQDSLATDAKKKAEGDTLSSGKRSGFNPGTLLLGGTIPLTPTQSIRIHPTLGGINFNTVDGFNAEYRLSYYNRFGPDKRLEISPLVRYAFSRNVWQGTLMSEYRYRSGARQGAITLEGGWYYAQFNREQPILPFVNSFSTLFFERNFIKVYDRNFAEARWRHDFTPWFNFAARVSYDKRIETFNTTRQVWFPWGRTFTPNEPVNDSWGQASFGSSNAFMTTLEASFRPGITYGRNNLSYYVRNNPPELYARYTRAMPGVMGSSPDIHLGAAGVSYKFNVGRAGTFHVDSESGKYFKIRNADFMDIAHFMGNETYFTRMESMNGYSILPFYSFSTSKYYVRTYNRLDFRELLLSKITALYIFGIKESLVLNHLYTPDRGHYTELGYSVNNIFRLFRVDFTTSFEGTRAREFRIQLGLSTALFSD